MSLTISDIRKLKDRLRISFRNSAIGSAIFEVHYKAYGNICFLCERKYKGKCFKTIDHLEGMEKIIQLKIDWNNGLIKSKLYRPLWSVIIVCEQCNRWRDHTPLDIFIKKKSFNVDRIKNRWFKVVKCMNEHINLQLNEGYKMLLFAPDDKKKYGIYRLYWLGQKYREFERINKIMINL